MYSPPCSLAETLSDVAVEEEEERDLLVGEISHEGLCSVILTTCGGVQPHSHYGIFFLHAVKAAARTVRGSAAGGVVVVKTVGRARGWGRRHEGP